MESVQYDQVWETFNRRYRRKKLVNLCISGWIVVFGVSSFLFGLRLEPVPTIFRFMTVDGTLFTTLGAAVFLIVNLVEIEKETELTSAVIYYIRLSCATAETVIFVVVMFSQLPVFSEHLPVIDRYDSFIMHVVIPVLMVTSFLVNDSPIGRLRPRKIWHGTWFVTTYAVTVFSLIGTGLLPHALIPYFFLDVKNNPWYITATAFVFIYGVAWLMSWRLSEANRRLSWLWFRDIARRQ